MMSWYIDSSCISALLRGCNAEEALSFPHAVGERVDVVVARVDVERRPRRGGDAVAADHRPGAVVPAPDGDAEVVEDLAHVVRVDALDGEGDRASAGHGVGRADHGHAGDL